MPDTSTETADPMAGFWSLFDHPSPEAYLLERERLREVCGLFAKMVELAPEDLLERTMKAQRRQQAAELADKLEAVDPDTLSPAPRESRSAALSALRLAADPTWGEELTDRDFRRFLATLLNLGTVEAEMVGRASIADLELHSLVHDVESITLVDVDVSTVAPLLLGSDDPELAAKAQALQAEIDELQKPSAREQELAAAAVAG